MTRLVVPLDTSTTAETALHWGAMLARDRAMELHLVTVWSEDAPIPGIDSGQSTPAILEELGSYLETVADKLKREGVPVTFEARAGDVVEEIRATAKPPGDMILLASHGAGGYQESRLGSTAERLIRSTKVPVLVIPAAGE